MFKRGLFTSLLLAASTLFSVANAAVIEDSVSISSVQPDELSITNFYDIVFPQFDDNGGQFTLNQVEITIEVLLTGSFTWTNNSGVDSSPSSRFIFSFDLNTLGGSDIFNTPFQATSYYSPGLITAGDTDSVNFSSAVPDPNPVYEDSMVIDSSTSTGPFLLSDFLGAGDITTRFGSTAETGNVFSGNFELVAVSNLEAILNYRYTYTENIVEASSPSVLGVFGLALILLGFRSRLIS